AAIRQYVAGLERRPRISLIMPVYNTPEQWLRRAIASVQAQLYPHWELCIADDASTLPHVRRVLEEAAADARIRLTFREANGGIAAASNSALALAGGDFVGLLDHDDELAETALVHVAAALNGNAQLDFLYSDEDKLDEQGRRCDAYFKPDWNRELVLQQNYVCHFAVYRRQVLQQVGGFRAGFEGSQDYDLMLRVTERIPAGHIHHIPQVLYRWRKIPGSTALAVENKDYAAQAARRAVQEHLERTGTRARVEDGLVPHRHRVRYETPEPPPLVSLIIPTRDGYALLKQCLDSILRKTDYAPYEILVVDNQSTDPQTLDYFKALGDSGQARVLPYDRPFNFSAINNFAVAQARGEVVCLLNNDTEVLTPDWLRELVSYAIRPEIGAVGAKLLYADRRIQHAGVLLGIGDVAGHAHRFYDSTSTGYCDRLVLAQELSAVTAACLAVRRAVYQQVGGMNTDDLRVAFNDVDFCLRILRAGYRNVWTPYAELLHYESATRGADITPEQRAVFQKEVRYMQDTWGDLLANDPAYNPNLSLQSEWFRLAWPPRTHQPWRAAPEPESPAQAGKRREPTAFVSSPQPSQAAGESTRSGKP
ncbi:MAG TPA: glycosyltransferase, partial [bacterium]|nr:glycosyltransferase [bacterium]